MKQKVIIDVDTGTDDAVALMVAALSPDLELVGATTVNGNCPVDVCTVNTLRVLEHIGVNIPVYEGCALPLTSTLTPGRRPNFPHYRGSSVHGLYLDIPETDRRPERQHAVDWLIETYLASEGDITLVPVGPLTNIGLAIRKEPKILEKIPEIVIMGGGHEIGNSTPSAEFNIWADPEAARIVMNCGRPIRLVPLDATHRALVSLAQCEELRSLETPAATATAQLVESRIANYAQNEPMERLDSAPVHDALVVCSLLEPDILSTEYLYVDVEVQGDLTNGRTVIDRQHRLGQAPNVHVAFDADEERFGYMLVEILGQTVAGQSDVSRNP